MIKRFLSDESGATAIEYAMLAMIITVGIIAAIGSMGDSIITMFDGVHGGFNQGG